MWQSIGIRYGQSRKHSYPLWRVFSGQGFRHKQLVQRPLVRKCWMLCLGYTTIQWKNLILGNPHRGNIFVFSKPYHLIHELQMTKNCGQFYECSMIVICNTGVNKARAGPRSAARFCSFVRTLFLSIILSNITKGILVLVII